MEIMEEDEDEPPRNACHLKHTPFASSEEVALSFQENGRLRIIEAGELRRAGLSQRRAGNYKALQQIATGLFGILLTVLLIHFRLLPTGL